MRMVPAGTMDRRLEPQSLVRALGLTDLHIVRGTSHRRLAPHSEYLAGGAVRTTRGPKYGVESTGALMRPVDRSEKRWRRMRDLWSGTYREQAVWGEMGLALIALANLVPGMCALDVGSDGAGTLLPAPDRIGETESMVGKEIDGEWADWLRGELGNRKLRNAKSLVMNAETMVFPDASFDAVILGMVGVDGDYDFEGGWALREAPLTHDVFRVLRPGDSIHNSGWIRQEDGEWMAERVRRRLRGCAKRGYCPATPRGYADLLEAVGFENVRAVLHEGHHTFDEPAEWMACLDHVWEEEPAQIKADLDATRAFECDVIYRRGRCVDAGGKLAYVRSAVLVSARKPPEPSP